jgi:hypothetical protein
MRNKEDKSVENNSDLNLLTLKDLKAYFGIGNDKVVELLNRADFPSFKKGRSWYVEVNDLNEWMIKQTKKVYKKK